MKILFTIFFITAGLLSHSVYTQTATLNVQISNIKNNDGRIGALIFQEEKGYPGDFKKALYQQFGSIADGTSEIVFKDVAPGAYVVTVMHDENANGKFDKDVFGRPKEGYGVSNNPSPRTFGPPKFKNGIITLNNNDAQIEIELLYND